MTSSGFEKFAGTYKRPVDSPSAPSSIASSTSFFISSSSSAVGSRSSKPITVFRAHVWPAKKPTFGATESDAMCSPSG